MKCPLCRTELDERGSSRLRRSIKAVSAVVIVAVLLLSLYSYWSASRIDLSHDVLFLLPNTLVYSVHLDAPVATGGVVAVYGNVSNPSSLEDSWVNTHISINVFDGYNDTHFHFNPGVLYGGQSLYFSWAYHFDQLNVSLCEVEIMVFGS